MNQPLIAEPEAVYSALRSGVVGWQGVLDMHGCRAPRIDDVEWVRSTMLEAARRAHATIITDNFHRFEPYGISGVVVIAESHLSIHTWPERGFAAIDVFTCSTQLMLRACVDYLLETFRPEQHELLLAERGGLRIAIQNASIQHA